MTGPEVSDDDRRNMFALILAILDEDAEGTSALVNHTAGGGDNLFAAAVVIADRLAPSQREELRKLATIRLGKPAR
jgi:hypothetical protein